MCYSFVDVGIGMGQHLQASIPFSEGYPGVSEGGSVEGGSE